VRGSPPPRLVGADWLERPETQAVFAALAARGYAARAVGGAVRNALAGRPVADVDLATDARPEKVMSAAEAAGLRVIPTGLAHGTVTVVAGERPYEITTLRRDVETHGRHATVAFTDDWAEDARRRDFTLNALYCGADGTIFDPLGGYPDLVARRVRFIGDAAERIREDYLRILRFFRLTADFAEGPPDAESLAACVRERAGLAILSAERVRVELLRLLAAPRGPEIAALMQDYGLLPAVLGAAPRPTLIARLAAIEAALGLSPDAVLRLAALAVEVEEDAERLHDRLRLSNDQAAKLAHAACWRDADIGPASPEAAARVYLYRHGPAAYRERVLIAWTRSAAPPESEDWRHRFGLPERWQIPRFPVKGADVLAVGVEAGPRVGEILRAAEEWWVEGGFTADEAAVRAKLAELAARGQTLRV
jgi:poly(A) polymerase